MLKSKEEIYLSKLKTLPVYSLRLLCQKKNLGGKETNAHLIQSILKQNIPEREIDKHIKSTYNWERNKKIEETGATYEAIEKELNKIDSHIWGMVQGKVDAYIQKNFVRKYFQYSELIKNIKNSLYPAMQSYTLCTWYNHWSNNVIEDVIADHPAVVPTVKNIKGIDLFWLGQPWDLKTTNLPKEWFRDSHTIEDAIKAPTEAARYLYELQGADRFGADNRLFIIIADSKNLDDSWKIKRDFVLLKKSINDFFDSTTRYDTVNFIYGNKAYIAHSKILFIVK